MSVALSRLVTRPRTTAPLPSVIFKWLSGCLAECGISPALLSVDSVEESRVGAVGAMTTPSAVDQVALGKTFEGSSGLSRGRRLPGGRGRRAGINLKQQAC